jgi:hypothetical protein
MITYPTVNDFPKAFNEDIHLQQTFIDLVKKHEPDLILETGTFKADTTEFFCSFNLPVITTELVSVYFEESKIKLQNQTNVKLFLGDSAVSLQQNFSLIQDKKIVAFLDSHFNNDKVLERELELFKHLEKKPILIIHDFYVPGTDLGYDTWDGHRYDYEFYKSYFDGLYGVNGYVHSYNSEATGARRGVIIVEPV